MHIQTKQQSLTHTIKEPWMVLQHFRSSHTSKKPQASNGSILIYANAACISFLLEHEELANHIIRNNDHNLRDQLHQHAVPMQLLNKHKKHQFFYTESQKTPAEETGQLCPETLGRIRRGIEDPGLVRNKLEQMIAQYILQRKQLVNVFVLIDIRHEQQKIDREFVDWLGESNVPFSIIFTKADKLSPAKAKSNALLWMRKLEDRWENLPPYFITSAEQKMGKDEVLDYIEQINETLV